MSFVEQEDIFKVIETLMVNLFKKFSDKKITNKIFPKLLIKLFLNMEQINQI